MLIENMNPIRGHSHEGYNQFIKVLLIKVSDMLDSSNFIRLFHCQSFALYSIVSLDNIINHEVGAFESTYLC